VIALSFVIEGIAVFHKERKYSFKNVIILVSVLGSVILAAYWASVLGL